MSEKKQKVPFKQKVANCKQRAMNYKQDMKTSYGKAYKVAWVLYEEIPNTRGARAAAKVGFHKGLSRHHKANKYASRTRK